MARNTLLNVLGLGAPLLFAVVAIPPLLASLGPERFGLLGMLWVAIAYLNLLDLGLGRATTRFAAPALRDGDHEELSAILGSALVLQLALGVAGGLVAYAAAPFLARDVLALTGDAEAEAARAFAAVAMMAPVLTLSSAFRGLLEAGQRFGLINAIRVPVSAANFLVPLGGVALSWDLGRIALALVVVRTLALAIYAVACVRSWPGLLTRMSVAPGRLRTMLRFGGWVTISGVAGALMVYVDRFAIGGLRSVAEAGFYTVPHEIVTRLDILPASLVLTLFPALAAIHGTSERGRGNALFGRSILYLVALVGPPLLLLAVAGRDLLTVWLDAHFAAQAAGALRLLAVGMMANAIAYVPYAAIHAAGRPDLTARIHVAELPAYAIALVLLVRAFGIEGAAAAWALRTTADAVVLLYAARRLGVAGSVGARLLPLVGALALLGAVAAAVVAVIDDPRVALVGCAVLALVWLIGCWTVLLGREERAHMRAALTGARRLA